MKQIDISSNTKEFYENFRIKLTEHHDFPCDYTFKFILENKTEFLTEIYRVFDDIKNRIHIKESKNGKYISCTIVSFVLDADQVIHLYKETSKINGVIML